ncbi:5301_t:CDS:2 [Racocetra fulgida]|uniref:5301_t:CDS:1 n=1 Tax=Racocetra fulgida TaxID=60492 RepID=A0A9N9DAF6_9GLOM|nr:5301_t:CDS:2 [Racocetra fulgida]
MSSNPFSEIIPCRPGNPTHLLNYMCLDDDYDEGLILLDEQALRILRKVEEPIAVITGINDPNQEVPWANKLFVLCLAISSTLIYNINGVIGRDDIDKLFLMTKIASLIQPPNELQFLPDLVVLLRDFQLDSPPDFVEYFLDRLSNVNDDGKFKHYINLSKMRNMSTIRTDKLDPVFVTNIEEAVTNIFKNLSPKYLDASAMTGVAFAEFLERCVAQINDPENTMLSIPSAYEATIDYAAQKAYEICIERYDEKMNQMMSQMNIDGSPISWEKFENTHSDAFESAHNDFIKQILGDANQIQSFRKTFCDKITALKDKYYKENSAALIKYHEEWAHKLWEEHVAPGLEITNLFDTDEFEEAINLFEQIYGTIVKPGQEAVQVLNGFKANQYEYSIRLLNNYNALREERANEMLARQQIERQQCELLQEEMKLRTEIINVKAENEKIQKQLEEKIKTIEKGILDQEQREQAFEKLNNENDRMLKQLDDYNRMLNKVNEENQSKVNSLQNQLTNNNRKKSDMLSVVRDLGVALAPLIFSTIFN